MLSSSPLVWLREMPPSSQLLLLHGMLSSFKRNDGLGGLGVARVGLAA